MPSEVGSFTNKVSSVKLSTTYIFSIEKIFTTAKFLYPKLLDQNSKLSVTWLVAHGSCRQVADVTEVQLTVSDVITIFIKASSEPGDSRKKTRWPLLFQAALIEKKKVQIEAGI